MTSAEPVTRAADSPLIVHVFRSRVQGQGSDVFLIDATGGHTVTYAECFSRVAAWVQCGRQHGVHPGDRVAVLLPNSTAFVEVALAAACAGWVFVPMPVTGGADLVARIIAHSQPRWVVAHRSQTDLFPDPAVQAIVRWSDAPLAGGDAAVLAATPDPGGLGAILYTSGTTAAPKGAMFSHRQLGASAANVAGLHELRREDRWLAVMPLCHSSGFGSMLGVLSSGGVIILAPHFAVARYWDWVSRYRATWLQLTPAMITQLLRSNAQPGPSVTQHVRFVRSATGALPEGDRLEFERRFGLPLIEGMGCTEAGPIFLNPLPPRPCRPGSVGRARSFDVRIVDGAGQDLAAGEAGTLLVRGPTVMHGYFRDPQRTAEVLSGDGWLRTGDRAMRDTDGFVYLLSREGERINKGGVKIAPGEVEAVLERHPTVRAAKVVGVPDAIMGEDIVAFVEPAAGQTIVPAALHAECTAQLGAFRSPGRIVAVAALPRNALGKVVTRELLAAAQTAPALRSGLSPDDLAQAVRGLWGDLLPGGPVDDTADFFERGGHSLLAAEMLAHLRDTTGVDAPLSSLYDHPVLAEFVRHLQASAPSAAAAHPDATVVRYGPAESAGTPKLLCLYSVGSYRALAAALSPGVATLGVCTQRELDIVLHGKGDLPASLTDLARDYVGIIRSLQAHGPYHLLGWSFGGRVALEVARHLRTAGESIGLLVSLDTYLPGAVQRTVWRWLGLHLRGLLGAGPAYVRRASAARRYRRGLDERDRFDVASVARARDARLRTALGSNDPPAPYDGPVVLFRACQRHDRYPVDPLLGWGKVAAAVHVHELDSTHDGLLAEPAVREVATTLREYMAQAVDATAPR